MNKTQAESYNNLVIYALIELYYCEKLQFATIPSIIKRANSKNLRRMLVAHKVVTNKQVKRLKGLFILISLNVIPKAPLDMYRLIKIELSKVDKHVPAPKDDVHLINMLLELKALEITSYERVVENIKLLNVSRICRHHFPEIQDVITRTLREDIRFYSELFLIQKSLANNHFLQDISSRYEKDNRT